MANHGRAMKQYNASEKQLDDAIKTLTNKGIELLCARRATATKQLVQTDSLGTPMLRSYVVTCIAKKPSPTNEFYTEGYFFKTKIPVDFKMESVSTSALDNAKTMATKSNVYWA